MATKKKAARAAAPEGPSIRSQIIHPTFVMVLDWGSLKDTLNASLGYEIMRNRTRFPDGNPRSNSYNCWHSKDDILSQTGEYGKELGSMFDFAFRTFYHRHNAKGELKHKLQAWAMMYRDGSYATPHTHPNCHASGVYYVQVPPEEERKDGSKVAPPGTLELMDLRGGPGQLGVPGTSLGGNNAHILPKEGRMVIFPSWQPHWVHPVRGDMERISVACNSQILSYKPEKE